MTYRELRYNKAKREEFRKMLPFNFASQLHAKYVIEAKESGRLTPKYSYSTIRKVASGERHNEEVLRDLIVMAKELELFNKITHKFKKNGKISL